MVAPTTWHALAAAAMAAAAVGVATAAAVDERNRDYHLLLVIVPLVGTVSYGLLALGVGTVGMHDNPLPLLRYLDWLVTTPVLVAYLGLLAGCDWRATVRPVGLVASLFVLGLAGAVAGGAVRAVSYLLAVAVFAGLAYLLSVPMQGVANERDDRVRALFERLRNFAVVLLALYPVVWVAGPFGLGLVNPDVEVLVVAYLDVLTRGGFAAIAVSNRGALDALRGEGIGDVLAAQTAD